MTAASGVAATLQGALWFWQNHRMSIVSLGAIHSVPLWVLRHKFDFPVVEALFAQSLWGVLCVCISEQRGSSQHLNPSQASAFGAVITSHLGHTVEGAEDSEGLALGE